MPHSIRFFAVNGRNDWLAQSIMGYVTSCTMTTERGRERKYYRLTDSGLRQLEHKEQEW